MVNKKMKEKDNGKVFIILALLGLVLIPLLMAKPQKIEGDVMGTEFTRVNGLLK